MSIKLPAGKAQCEGYLTKQSQWLKEWRKRYFMLYGNQLYFCKAKGEQAHGIIDLSKCLTVKSADDKTGRKHSFEIQTPQEVYFLFADNEQGKDEWIGAIGKAIVTTSRSAYIRDEEDDEDEDE